MIEDEMVGRHHRLNGHEFEQTLGDSAGQESLVASCESKLCLTLRDPMDCNMPGFSVLHHLPELAQTPVH